MKVTGSTYPLIETSESRGFGLELKVAAIHGIQSTNLLLCVRIKAGALFSVFKLERPASSPISRSLRCRRPIHLECYVASPTEQRSGWALNKQRLGTSTPSTFHFRTLPSPLPTQAKVSLRQLRSFGMSGQLLYAEIGDTLRMWELSACSLHTPTSYRNMRESCNLLLERQDSTWMPGNIGILVAQRKKSHCRFSMAKAFGPSTLRSKVAITSSPCQPFV